MNKTFIKVIIAVLLLISVTAFILINSSMNYEKSHNSSDKIVEIIQSNDQKAETDTKLMFRKAAHLIEYAFLGIAACCCFLIIKPSNKSLQGFALFYVLAVAVIDEHIQSFSDRTSSTGDIILDFIGSIIGFLIVGIIMLMVLKIKNQKYKQHI